MKYPIRTHRICAEDIAETPAGQRGRLLALGLAGHGFRRRTTAVPRLCGASPPQARRKGAVRDAVGRLVVAVRGQGVSKRSPRAVLRAGWRHGAVPERWL